MPNRNLFPEEKETQNSNESSAPSKGLLESIFGIGSIGLPEGNKLAIWMLVVVVIIFIIFFYFFMNIMDKMVDKALNPDSAGKVEMQTQKDYNELLKQTKILKAENEYLKDSLENQPEDLRRNTDAVIYEETSPHIQQLKKIKR